MELHLLSRLFVTTPLIPGQNVIPSDEQAHYLLHVLRLKPGNSLRLFNGQNGEWLGTIAAVSKRSVEISLKEQIRPQAQEPDVRLYCAPIKKAHFEYTIEKATELGVADLCPVATTRTQIREVNTERCRMIAIEAAEQSERLNIPSIHKAVSLKKCVEEWPSGYIPFICAERGDAIAIHDAFSNLPPLQKAAFCVGPEGGFTAEEFDMLRTLPHARFIRLGPRILRADTAVLAALSCWQALCGDWRYTLPFTQF